MFKTMFSQSKVECNLLFCLMNSTFFKLLNVKKYVVLGWMFKYVSLRIMQTYKKVRTLARIQSEEIVEWILS